MALPVACLTFPYALGSTVLSRCRAVGCSVSVGQAPSLVLFCPLSLSVTRRGDSTSSAVILDLSASSSSARRGFRCLEWLLGE